MSELLKDIHKNIKKINNEQKKLNQESVPSSINKDVREHIDNLGKTALFTKESNPEVTINSISKTHKKIDYKQLSKQMAKDKTYLKALDMATQRKIPQEDINKFIEEVLPEKSLISYYYKDDFNTSKKFDEWNSNFIFVENPETAYVRYSPDKMSENAKQDQNTFSSYFKDGDLILGGAYLAQIEDLESLYDADAEPQLSKEDLDKSTKVKLAKSNYKDTKVKFGASQTNMNPSRKTTLSNKRRWKTGPNIPGVDPTRIFSGDTFSSQKAGEKDLSKGDQTLFSHIAVTDVQLNETNGVESAKIERRNFNYVSNEFVRSMLNAKGKTLTLNNGSKAVQDYYGPQLEHNGYTTKNVYDFAYYPMGNIAYPNIANTNDFGGLFTMNWVPKSWFGTSWVGDGTIADILYALYTNSSTVPNLGKTINHFLTHGVSTKSELDLQTNLDYGANTQGGYFDYSKKLHVATVIGFKTYNKQGRERLMYLSSSKETIPDTREEYKDFSVGRIKAGLDQAKADLIRYRNNSAIEAIMRAGPDFMSNMFDVSIFSYKTFNGSTKGVDPEAIHIANFFVDANLYNESSEKAKQMMAASEKNALEQNASSSISMLSTREDFFTRIASISIPNMKSSTIDYSFLNQKYTVPGYKNEQEFNSSFSVELDAGLEYLRLFNMISGLRFGGKVNNVSFNGQMRPLRNRFGNQKLGILVRLTPNNPFLQVKLSNELNGDIKNVSERFIVFEDVLFMGGGDVKFSNSSSGGLVTYTQQFIYKNLNIYPFTGVKSGTLLPDYQPAIQNLI